MDMIIAAGGGERDANVAGAVLPGMRSAAPTTASARIC
jgi:hypothetical protein